MLLLLLFCDFLLSPFHAPSEVSVFCLTAKNLARRLIFLLVHATSESRFNRQIALDTFRTLARNAVFGPDGHKMVALVSDISHAVHTEDVLRLPHHHRASASPRTNQMAISLGAHPHAHGWNVHTICSTPMQVEQLSVQEVAWCVVGCLPGDSDAASHSKIFHRQRGPHAEGMLSMWFP